MTSRADRWGVAVLAGVSLATTIALVVVGPIGQPPGYHSFADRRAILGIPAFWNVVSNLAFVLAGGWGLLVLMRRDLPGLLPPLRPAWTCFFAGSVLIGVGSALYHLSPTDATLAWDRLPMTVAFTSLLAVVLGEQVDLVVGRSLLPGLLTVGVASIAVWRLTGDLRLYVLVQYLPILLIALALLLFRSPFRSNRLFWAGLLLYGGAKAFELLDAPLHRALGAGGGHPFKHVLAAAAIAVLVIALLRRRPAEA